MRAHFERQGMTAATPRPSMVLFSDLLCCEPAENGVAGAAPIWIEPSTSAACPPCTHIPDWNSPAKAHQLAISPDIAVVLRLGRVSRKTPREPALEMRFPVQAHERH